MTVISNYTNENRGSIAQSVEHLSCHNRSQSEAPPMLVCKYIDENGLAAMLATKRLAGVTSEVNLREHTSQMPWRSVDKAAHSGFETQRRHHQKSKTWASVAPQKELMSSKDFLKKITPMHQIINILRSLFKHREEIMSTYWITLTYVLHNDSGAGLHSRGLLTFSAEGD